MAQHRQVILICDLCGVEEPSAVISTHRITVDGNSRDAEVCDGCWASVVANFAVFASGGREPEKRKIKKADIMEWPDTPWKFTRHAMLRMGERGVSPAAVLRALADQDIRRPGKYDGEEIWERDRIKVVVNPDKQHILTVSKRDEAEHLQAVS